MRRFRVSEQDRFRAVAHVGRGDGSGVGKGGIGWLAVGCFAFAVGQGEFGRQGIELGPLVDVRRELVSVCKCLSTSVSEWFGFLASDDFVLTGVQGAEHPAENGVAQAGAG